jgi:hypothetical protein
MTHDELMDKVDNWDCAGMVDEPAVKALRAVVELCNFLDKKGRCCVPVEEVIDAIKKELK